MATPKNSADTAILARRTESLLRSASKERASTTNRSRRVSIVAASGIASGDNAGITAA